MAPATACIQQQGVNRDLASRSFAKLPCLTTMEHQPSASGRKATLVTASRRGTGTHGQRQPAGEWRVGEAKHDGTARAKFKVGDYERALVRGRRGYREFQRTSFGGLTHHRSKRGRLILLQAGKALNRSSSSLWCARSGSTILLEQVGNRWSVCSRLATLSTIKYHVSGPHPLQLIS